MKAINIFITALLIVGILFSLAHTTIKAMGQHVINGCVKGEHVKFKLNDDITIKCEVVRGDD